MADVVMTVNGGRDTADTIDSSDCLLGFESSKTVPEPPVQFVDFPFTNPDATIDSHVEMCSRIEPKYAVAPDVEGDRSLDDVVDVADRLLEYADVVIVVPKSVHPSRVPDRFRVGVPAANFGSGADWMMWDYHDVGPVHILGGGPRKQLKVGNHLNVGSVDTSALQMGCSFGEWWVDRWVQAPDDVDFYGRLRRSLDEYAAAWQNG